MLLNDFEPQFSYLQQWANNRNDCNDNSHSSYNTKDVTGVGTNNTKAFRLVTATIRVVAVVRMESTVVLQIKVNAPACLEDHIWASYAAAQGTS